MDAAEGVFLHFPVIVFYGHFEAIAAIGVQVLVFGIAQGHGGQGAVRIEYPLAHVARHVVEAEIVGHVGAHFARDMGIVVEFTCDTHVVALALFEVGHDGTLVFVAHLIAHRVAVPGVVAAVGVQFVLVGGLVAAQG